MWVRWNEKADERMVKPPRLDPQSTISETSQAYLQLCRARRVCGLNLLLFWQFCSVSATVRLRQKQSLATRQSSLTHSMDGLFACARRNSSINRAANYSPRKMGGGTPLWPKATTMKPVDLEIPRTRPFFMKTFCRLA